MGTGDDQYPSRTPWLIVWIRVFKEPLTMATTVRKQTSTQAPDAVSPGEDLERQLRALADQALGLVHCDGVDIARRGSDGDLRTVVSVGDTTCRDHVLTVPLVAGSSNLGELSLFRLRPGDWDGEEVVFAAVCAQRAADAMINDSLVEARQLQVAALERMAGMLSAQAQDYANRLHAVAGLLALGEAGEAERFLADLSALHHETSAAVAERVGDAAIAGLLVAQMNAARQRGVEVRLHRASKVGSLPATSIRSDLMLVLANLLENAIEATVAQEKARRRASIRLAQRDRDLSLTVRDWGDGPGAPADEVHLAAVVETVRGVGGEIVIETKAPGTSVQVRLPLGDERTFGRTA